MIYIFDNLTDKIDFATILVYILESPSDHKFIFTGKDKIFYDHLIDQPKIKGYLATYYPNLKQKYTELLSNKLVFTLDYKKCVSDLKNQKYIIFGTTPNKLDSENVFSTKLTKKCAFVFGSENGLSKEKKELLSKLVHYPLKNASFLKLRHIFPIVYGINMHKQFKPIRLK
jgi:hypothetical protein